MLPWGRLSNRNEYQVYFLGGKAGRCLGLTTVPPSCVYFLEIWELQPPGTFRACAGFALTLQEKRRKTIYGYVIYLQTNIIYVFTLYLTTISLTQIVVSTGIFNNK
jgi:hypothetical protein